MTTSRGLEKLLADELIELGLEASEVPGGATFRGSIADGMRAALWTRIGMHVLMQIGRAELTCGNDLYDAVRRLPLDDWFNADATIAVHSRINDSKFRDSRFVAQKAKDAIVPRHGRNVVRAINNAPRPARPPHGMRRSMASNVFAAGPGSCTRVGATINTSPTTSSTDPSTRHGDMNAL